MHCSTYLLYKAEVLSTVLNRNQAGRCNFYCFILEKPGADYHIALIMEKTPRIEVNRPRPLGPSGFICKQL